MKQQHKAVRRGRVAEYLTAAWLLHHLDVFIVFPPDPSECDLLVQVPGLDKWLSIQVKLTWYKDGYCVANVSKSNGQPYNTDYIIAIALSEVGRTGYWVLPTKEIKEKTRVNLRDYAQYYYNFEDAPFATILSDHVSI